MLLLLLFSSTLTDCAAVVVVVVLVCVAWRVFCLPRWDLIIVILLTSLVVCSLSISPDQAASSSQQFSSQRFQTTRAVLRQPTEKTKDALIQNNDLAKKSPRLRPRPPSQPIYPPQPPLAPSQSNFPLAGLPPGTPKRTITNRSMAHNISRHRRRTLSHRRHRQLRSGDRKMASTRHDRFHGRQCSFGFQYHQITSCTTEEFDYWEYSCGNLWSGDSETFST